MLVLIWRFLFLQGVFFTSAETLDQKKLHFFQIWLRSKKLLFAGLSCLLLLFGSPLHGQTIVPAGLGPMNSIQPDRNTAILSGNLLSTGGQNPIVRIVWGDEDRGANVSALSTWDNIVEISTNQGVGSFSTTITIPNQEKIYYFRSVAENAGGSVVSRSLGVFTPSAVVGASELRGRWSFDDDNFSSSVDFSNLKLWLDANDSSTIIHSSDSVSQWNDKSGNDNHALQSTTANQPTITSTGIQFDGSNDGLLLPMTSGGKFIVFIVSQVLGMYFQ